MNSGGCREQQIQKSSTKSFWAQRQNTLLFRLLTDVVVVVVDSNAAAIVVVAVRHLEF